MQSAWRCFGAIILGCHPWTTKVHQLYSSQWRSAWNRFGPLQVPFWTLETTTLCTQPLDTWKWISHDKCVFTWVASTTFATSLATKLQHWQLALLLTKRERKNHNILRLRRVHVTTILGPFHTRDGEPVTITLRALSLVGKVEAVQVCFPLCLRDQRSMRIQDGCKVYMGSYVVLNGSCFTVIWTIFKNHLLEVGLTQDRETMAPRTFTTVDLVSFIMCDDPHE